MPHRELMQEQEYVDVLYSRLDQLRAEKERQLTEVRRTVDSSSPQGMSERDAFAQLYEDRLSQLNAVDDRLVFGRLDMESGENHYIGRIGLSDDDLRQLLIDWRAPEAGLFYQATAFDRRGVTRRRHLFTARRKVTGVEDDVLDVDLLRRNPGNLRGEGALLAAINAPKTGRMNDIVATIHAEQDRIIRSALGGTLVVQGGPGTGKTAIALHRTAYLLYTHREKLSDRGVLLLGPSRSFLKYIERVLPSLGETGVVMGTVAGLYPPVSKVVPEKDQHVVGLKGSLDMLAVLRKAVADRQIVPARDQTFQVEGVKVTLTPKQFRRARERARATGKPHNEARVVFVKNLLRDMVQDIVAHHASTGRAMDEEQAALVDYDLRGNRDVRVALNLAWMPSTPETLLRKLWSKPERLRRAAPRLDAASLRALRRDADAPFTEADIPLLDELAELLGEMPVNRAAADAAAQKDRERDVENARRAIENSGTHGLVSAERIADQFAQTVARGTLAERAEADRTWTFGHVVVDEAQELSPMAWHALMRRIPSKSMTIVGDIAQTSSAAGAKSWEAALEPHLGDRFRLEQLTVNYRTPGKVTALAGRVAGANGLDLAEPVAVREGNWEVERSRVAQSRLLDRLAEQVSSDIEALEQGNVAVIAPAGLLPSVVDSLDAALGNAFGPAPVGLDRTVVALSPEDAKGLEFDGVVLVEPAEILAQHGAGSLYVCMTRASQKLSLVHSLDLPAGF